MNGGGKPGLRVSAATDSDFEGVVGGQLTLAVVPAEAQPGTIHVAAAVYDGKSLAVKDSEFTIAVAAGNSVLVLVLHATSDVETANLVEKDSTGNRYALSSIQYRRDRPTAIYRIRGI
jgi:hypothetical protein